MYAPLWCKSNFSFLEGASHAEELIAQAHTLGLRSIAITDRDSVSGLVKRAMDQTPEIVSFLKESLQDQ